ncbi:MAG: hypothetical protein AB8B50_17325 [Pirellulaceae bacterium]
MRITSAEIESIVRAVIQRIEAMPRASLAMPAGSSSAGKTGNSLGLQVPVETSAATTSTAAELRLSDPVISLESLRNRLGGVRVLRVQKTAVVTPAVRDELRSRDVQLVRESVKRVTRTGRSNILVVNANHSSQALVDLAEVIAPTSNCSADVGRIAAHLNSGGSGAIWCSATPFAAVRACGRNAALRAIQLPCIKQVDQALSEAEPNLLILDQASWNEDNLVEVVQLWAERTS